MKDKNYEGPTLKSEDKVKEIAIRWKSALELWRIPEEIVAKAPQNPFSLNPKKFHPDQSRRESGTVRELERLISNFDDAPPSLLDVGSGAGGISLLVASRVRSVVAIDQSRAMLDALADNANSLGVLDRITTIESSWPTSSKVSADIVLNANVLYNVPEIVPFVKALIDAAKESVVIEVTKNHPLSNVNALFQHFHGIVRPTTPTSTDVAELILALGYSPRIESWVRTSANHDIDFEERLDEYQNRACIEVGRREELRRYLEENELTPMEVEMIAFDK
ncbi:MAG: class I SAM-dependent methyltransferase [Actinomycetota bacterium]|nr:class I SAM-dependent methyltransferase [Actinomycetota bacterium]